MQLQESTARFREQLTTEMLRSEYSILFRKGHRFMVTHAAPRLTLPLRYSS